MLADEMSARAMQEVEEELAELLKQAKVRPQGGSGVVGRIWEGRVGWFGLVCVATLCGVNGIVNVTDTVGASLVNDGAVCQAPDYCGAEGAVSRKVCVCVCVCVLTTDGLPAFVHAAHGGSRVDYIRTSSKQFGRVVRKLRKRRVPKERRLAVWNISLDW
eukprot:5276355-Pyramimonas_sp.AAC.1